MKYNTKSITNILDNEVFVGKYGGVEIPFEAGETRYLPSFVSDHIVDQLLRRIREIAKENNKDLPNEGELRLKIVGEMIETGDESKDLSLKEEIDRHEIEFKKWQEEKKKKEMIDIGEAEKIIKKENEIA